MRISDWSSDVALPIWLGPIKHRAQEESDPVSVYLARREKQRADYETDRLLYVAATRARDRLHLVGTVVQDEDGGARAPAAGSLLARLWDYVDHARPAPAAASSVREPINVSAEPRHLIRLAGDALPEVNFAAAPVGPGRPWQWSEGTGDEAVIGTVSHAWLEYLGRQGIEPWSIERIADCVPLFDRKSTTTEPQSLMRSLYARFL